MMNRYKIAIFTLQTALGLVFVTLGIDMTTWQFWVIELIVVGFTAIGFAFANHRENGEPPRIG